MLKAQSGFLYNSQQRLSSSVVEQVYQDELGFIWVATDNGLNRYDGYSFLSFTTDDGLCSENIRCIISDTKNNLYVGTNAGLCVKLNGRFFVVKEEATGEDTKVFVSDALKASDGTVYFATSGRGIKVLTEKGELRSILQDLPKTQFSTSIKEDKNGYLWIATQKEGVFCVKKSGKGDSAKYSFVANFQLGSEGSVGTLCVDTYGNVFCGQYNGGLYIFRRNINQFVLIPGSESLPICELKARKNGEVFVGTNGMGLKVVDAKSAVVRDYYLSSSQLNLSKTKVESVLEDRSQNLWLGLLQKGLFMKSLRPSVFRNIGMRQGNDNVIGEACVNAMYRTKDGSLLVACDQDGIYHLDSSNHLVKHISKPLTVLNMHQDSTGKLWVATYTQGCGWLDIATGAYHRLPFSHDKAQNIFAVQEDYKHRLWFGTLGNGLKCYDPATETIKEHFAEYSEKQGLVNDFILTMEMSKDKKLLFVGTATGLSCLNVETGKWIKNFGKGDIITGKAIQSLRCAANGILWVGMEKGLFRIDIRTQQAKSYAKADGLANHNISAIETDRKGNVWVSTKDGLYRLDVKTDKFASYYYSDGLQGNEYNSRASFMDHANNTMYFAGTYGASYFNPEMVKERKMESPIVISSILLSGERVRSFDKSGGFTVCEEPVSECDRFDFCHHDNNLTLKFSTLSYSNNDRLSYSYSINGGTWITLHPGVNELTLSNMYPGDYHFKVVAISNGVKSPVKEFTIVVHNPWYFTPFARILYGILIILAVWNYFRVKNQQGQNLLRLQEYVHSEELKEQKIKLFTNVANEIRTPITLVLSPLIQLMKTDDDAARTMTYDIMKRNAERILQLLNRLLDNPEEGSETIAKLSQEDNSVQYVRDSGETVANASRRATMVIVDADDAFREQIVENLSSTYKVMAYSDGNEALPVILKELPQIVLAGVTASEMDGMTLCARMKSNVNTNHIPFILISSEHSDDEQLEALEIGADLYVTKPCNIDILRRQVQNLLNSRKLMENKFSGMEDQKSMIDDVEMETADDKLLQRIMNVVNANLGNSDLDIAMICSEVGISRVHLHRKMKELTNQTPHEFIRNLRLKQAARLLTKRGQNITEVIYRCGFNSATSFSTMFKKMYGLSPREYMKENAER